MAKTPFKDLGSVEILSGHISGLQHALNKIEEVLNMRTNVATQHKLNPVADQDDPALRYRIYEGTIRNWLQDPVPVIYRDGAVVQPSEYKIYPAYGVVVFNEQQSPASDIRADFTYVEAQSQTIKDLYVPINAVFWHPPGTWRGNGFTAAGVDVLIAANKADVFPFIVPERTRYTGIGFYIIKAAGNIDAVVYYDTRYPTGWINRTSATYLRDFLVSKGFSVKNADELKTWMQKHISVGTAPDAVCVMAQDVAPDTIVETEDTNCTLRQFLNAGGRIVWLGDWQFYFQGHADGTSTAWCGAGSTNILGFTAQFNNDASSCAITTDGTTWGLDITWPSKRALEAGKTPHVTLAKSVGGYPSAYVWYFDSTLSKGGFVRLHDTPGIDYSNQALAQDVYNVALYGLIAETKGRAAIYTDNNAYPGNLILDCGEFDTTTTGFKIINIDLTLDPGIYWVARNTDEGVTFAGFRESSVVALPFDPTGTYDGTPIAPVGGYRIDMTFGPFPDKFPAGAAYLRRKVYAGFFLRRE